MSDRGSVKSSGRNYRRVSSKSSVDETLFGNTGHDRYKKKTDGGREVPIYISEQQLNAIKARSIIQSQADKEAKQRDQAELHQDKIARAMERKAKMKKLEEERLNRTTLSVEEKEDEGKRNETLARADDARLENLDMVKTMRRKMIYAQCAKIRMNQIDEKSLEKTKLGAYEERQDILMEIQRLKDIEETEKRRKIREKLSFEDASQIRVQIQERQRQKIIEEEMLEQEKEHMKLTIKQQEEQARFKRKQQAIESKKLLNDVLRANDEAIQQKRDRIQEEKDEDERIAQWQEEKRLSEEALEAEKQRIKELKDIEFHHVASQMKRAQDNRSNEDALRAKRHQQEQERKQRDRERRETEKRQQQLRELTEARNEQSERKIKNLKLLALEDKEQWERINAENAASLQAIELAAMREKEAGLKHQRELREMMLRGEEEKRKKIMEKFEAGRKLKQEDQALLRKIQKKKEQILLEMEAENIPEKFRAEVAQMKVTL